MKVVTSNWREDGGKGAGGAGGATTLAPCRLCANLHTKAGAAWQRMKVTLSPAGKQQHSE